MFRSFPRPDPYDKTPTQEIGARQDMLWTIFSVTGKLEPVRAIASELAWGEDYDGFVAGRYPEFNDHVGRAAGYGAAGWSLGSFVRNDELAFDYVEVLACSADTPEIIRKELANLNENPAFDPEHRNGMQKRALPNPAKPCPR